MGILRGSQIPISGIGDGFLGLDQKILSKKAQKKSYNTLRM